MLTIAREKAGPRCPDDDMFFVTKQTLQAAIRQTPEGRVYYPNGRAGYVLNAETERNLARTLTAFFFLVVGNGTICGPIASQTHHHGLVLIVGVAAVVAIRAAAIAFVLRRAPRSTTLFSKKDAVNRIAATYSVERIWVMVFVVLLIGPPSIFLVRNESPWDLAVMIATFLAAAIYACVFAVRVLRAKAAMAAEPTSADRA